MRVLLQVAAADLGIPLSSVYIAETATDKVPNSSPTAASASSDMYGSATADACAQLNARLQPYRERRPDSTFQQLVNAAYLDRVDLSAHGFYATPDITGDLLLSRPRCLSCACAVSIMRLKPSMKLQADCATHQLPNAGVLNRMSQRALSFVLHQLTQVAFTA